MSHRAVPAILIAIAFVCPAHAADLSFSLGGEVEYDHNVFRRERNREDDVLFRLRPGVRVHEDRGENVDFSVRYELPVEFAAEHNEELQDEDHLLDGRFEYRVNDRLSIFGNDRLSFLRSTLRNVQLGSDADVVGTPQIGTERDRVTLNDASLGLRYRFAPRLQGNLVASSRYFDTTRRDRSENYSISGVGSADYVLTQKHQIGGGLRYTFQDFADRLNFSGSTSHTYNGFATWRWLIDPTLNLEISAGPSYLQTRQDDAAPARNESFVPFVPLAPGTTVFALDRNSNLANQTAGSAGAVVVPSFFANAGTGPTQNCASIDGQPVALGCTVNVFLDGVGDAAEFDAVQNSIAVVNSNPRGRSDESLTVFATAVIAKHWTPNLHSALRYRREQGDASGLGGTVILDAVSLSNTWDFAERWQLALRGDWTTRESAFELRQTLDTVQPTPVGTLAFPLAGRTGTAFNTDQDAEVSTRRWGVAGRITHRLFRSTLVYVQVRYDRQGSDRGSLGRSSDFENYLATFGVRHTFEPIKLW